MELKAAKEQLTNMVPYRALAGFFSKADTKAEWNSVKRMTAYIEKINRDVVLLPYTLGSGGKLAKEMYFQPDWIKMIQDNTVSILGWIQFEKVKWLQNNNPEVPGLVYKLAPMDEKDAQAESCEEALGGDTGTSGGKEMYLHRSRLCPGSTMWIILFHGHL